MKKIFISLLFALCLGLSALSAASKGEWKLHPSFDAYVKQMCDTRDKTYFTALGQIHAPGSTSLYKDPYPQLFVYDKATDELRSLNKQNSLNGNIVSGIYYNRSKGYLFIVYSDSNIDLLYDNGTLRNIPGLMSFNTNMSKGVNDVIFDAPNDRVYVATDFGFLVIDDERMEVAESKILADKVKNVARVGNRILVNADAGIFTYPVDKRVQSYNDMTPLEGITNMRRIFPLNDNLMGYVADLVTEGGRSQFFYEANLLDDGTLEKIRWFRAAEVNAYSEVRDGFYLSFYNTCYLLKMDGSVSDVSPVSEDRNTMTSSWDFREFWYLKGRKGLESRRYDFETKSWNVTRQYMMPNCPNSFQAEAMTYSSKYGMLVPNHGSNRMFTDISVSYPLLLSGYKDGAWTSYGIPFTHPDTPNIFFLPRGIVTEPSNPDLVYFASQQSGIIRLNLSNPDDLLRIGNRDTGNPDVGTLYRELAGGGYATTAALGLDSYGNMWTMAPREASNRIWVWKQADRLAGDPTKIKKFDVSGFVPDAHGSIYPLTSSANRNLVLLVEGVADGDIVILDNNGTIDDTTDDKTVTMGNIYNQDGGLVNKQFIYDIYEDPATGTVWVASFLGTFTFNPREIFNNPTRVRQIKVSRNDGTNLADYLLAGMRVNGIATDPSGDKWFATVGGGLVHTSSDGTHIIEQFTEENSLLPHNNVFSVEYNSGNNSMMVSTENGIAEYYLKSSASQGDESEKVKIYPNPVRPDYYGWINIEGIDDNALVKIVDSAGNLVRELGRAEGGTAQWDGTNHSQKRVRSGVYYILVSASSDGGENNVGKVVIIN